MSEYDNLRGSGLWFFLGDEWQRLTGGGLPGNHPADAFDRWRPRAVHRHAEGVQPLPDLVPCAGSPPTTTRKPTARASSTRRCKAATCPPKRSSRPGAHWTTGLIGQEYCATFETYEGRVLHAFSRAQHVRPCKDKLRTAARISIGVDFNINPMSAVVLVEEGGVDYQVDEVVLRTANTDDLVAEIRTRYARNGSLAHVTAYPDPAGAQRRTSAGGRTDIGILQASGMGVLAMGQPSSRARQEQYHQRAVRHGGRHGEALRRPGLRQVNRCLREARLQKRAAASRTRARASTTSRTLWPTIASAATPTSPPRRGAGQRHGPVGLVGGAQHGLAGSLRHDTARQRHAAAGPGASPR